MKSKHVPGIDIVPTDEPIDYWTRVEWSRQMPFSDKFLISIKMFEQACDDIRAKIRAHFPEIPKAAEHRILGVLIEKSRLDRGPQ